jgi:hypothetical protein
MRAILGHEAPAEAFVEMLTATFEEGVHRDARRAGRAFP